jgi:hypothetical protein
MQEFRAPFLITGGASSHNKAYFSRSVVPDQQLAARAHLSMKGRLFFELET